MIDTQQAITVFSALSQEKRLQILRILVNAGPEGLSAGTISDRVEVSPSNASFHLKELERAGLVSALRDSRSIIYSVDFNTLSGLIRFLMEDCCNGHPEVCNPAWSATACCAPSHDTSKGTFK